MFKKKFLLSAVSVVALIAPSMIEKAQAEETTTWQARSVDQVLTDVVYTDGKAEYTIQAGDTISVIAEALEIDLEILTEIDSLTNAELMTPDVELTAQYNAQKEVEVLSLETPEGMVRSFDITSGYPQELVVNAPVTTSSVVQPVEEWIETEEAPATNQTTPEVSETAEEAPVEAVMETPVTTDAPVQPDNVAPVEEWDVNEASEVIESNDVTEEITEPNVEESTEVVESPETEVASEVSSTTMVAESEVETPENTITTTETVESVEGIPATEEVVETIPADQEVAVEEIPEETFEDVEPEFEVVEETPAEAPVEEAPVDEPVYEEPVYEEPEYEEPVYEEPAVEESYDPYANPGNAGLTEDAARFKDEVANKFGVTSFSTVRPGDPGDHGTGRAVDFMVEVGSQLGDDIANYSTSNMAENNISYVIWEQQIYGDWNHQWTPMEDRGSITENHYDHVHVSFY